MGMVILGERVFQAYGTSETVVVCGWVHKLLSLFSAGSVAVALSFAHLPTL